MAERNDHIARNCAAELLATATVRVRKNSITSIHSQPASHRRLARGDGRLQPSPARRPADRHGRLDRKSRKFHTYEF